MAGRDDVKSEPFTMGSVDLGVLMADPYTEEDAKILSSGGCLTSDDVEDPDEELPLFGCVSVDVKADLSWDQCFGNLEDVDSLLSSGPDIAFGPGTDSPDGMQWHDSASPPAVQPEKASIAKSPMRTDCGAMVNGHLDAAHLRMEFVPGHARLEKAHVGVKAVGYVPADERWSGPQSGAQFMTNDCLHAGEAMAGDVSLSNINGDTSIAMDMSEDGAGASFVSQSDSEKASVAQAQRARRHAANRRRIEERSRRHLNHRRSLHGSAYSNSQAPSPPMLHPMPLQLSTHASHFNQPSVATLHGYAAPLSNLAPLQPMMRPAPPYLHLGYSPPIPHIQSVAPTSVSSQMQQGLFLGYQQPCSFQPALSQHQQFQLRPPLDGQICPPTSSSSMTPQEKIEKLGSLQHMQARFAVEQQQQQFVAQGVAPLDSSALGKGPTQLPQAMAAVRQPDVAATAIEMNISAVESDFEPSLSVGQTSMGTTSEDEGASMEAVVLDQLQSTMKSLEVETKLCIRDALYRLARSAMKRKCSGRQGGGGGKAGSSYKASEDADAVSDGLETSINSDPSSSSRVSRMNMTMVETQTNPIDRSIAHLLFYKTQQHALGQTAPNGGDAFPIVPTQIGLPDPQSNPSTWPQGRNLLQSSWRPGAPQALPVTGAMIQGLAAGVEVGRTSLLRPPMTLVIPAGPMSRLQVGPGCGATEILDQRTGMLSPLVTESGQLQNTILGTGMLNGELSSPMRSQCQPLANEEQRPLQAQQGTSISAQKVSLDCRSGVRSKRLEHALGLKELNQLLTEGLDVDSGCFSRDENALKPSGPPVNIRCP